MAVRPATSTSPTTMPIHVEVPRTTRPRMLTMVAHDETNRWRSRPCKPARPPPTAPDLSFCPSKT